MCKNTETGVKVDSFHLFNSVTISNDTYEFIFINYKQEAHQRCDNFRRWLSRNGSKMRLLNTSRKYRQPRV